MTQNPADTFHVVYHDGANSNGWKTTVAFEPFGWTMRVDRDGKIETKRWDVDAITMRRTSDGVYMFYHDAEKNVAVECRDPLALRALRERYPRRKSFREPKFVTGVFAMMALVVAGIVGLIGLAYFLLLPAFSGALVGLVSKETEEKIGEQLYTAYAGSYTVDDSLTAAVNAYASLIDFDTPYDIRITVVESPELNAFALPGGRVVVFNGLVEKMNRHEALAALLAHEAAHAKHRHSLRALARQLSGYALLALLLGDANAVVVLVAENAEMLNRLSYSRELETEADQDAVATFKRNNLDIAGMVHLFETFQREAADHPVQILSTHPLTEDRLALAKKEAAEQSHHSSGSAMEAAWKRVLQFQ